MPLLSKLAKAHQILNRAVDAAYGKTSVAAEAERVVFLFERYQQLTAPLAAAAKPCRREKGAKIDFSTAVTKKGA